MILRSALFTMQFTGATGATTVSAAKLGIAANRTVLFTVSISGVIKLQSLVTFDDSVVGSPGATVTVKSWNVSR